jgi:hypothetical protein
LGSEAAACGPDIVAGGASCGGGDRRLWAPGGEGTKTSSCSALNERSRYLVRRGGSIGGVKPAAVFELELAPISHQLLTSAFDSAASSQPSPSGRLRPTDQYACGVLASESHESATLPAPFLCYPVRNAGQVFRSSFPQRQGASCLCELIFPSRWQKLRAA